MFTLGYNFAIFDIYRHNKKMTSDKVNTQENRSCNNNGVMHRID